jgi:ribosomal-protein-alanine N-acetyltransferase
MNNAWDFPAITTKHLYIRKLEPFDLYGVFNLFSDPEVMKTDGGKIMKEISEARYYINVFSDPKSLHYTNSIRWAAAEKESNQFIGTCGFHNWHREFLRAEIGSDITRSHWNKGYGTEILHALIPYGFNSMNLNRISAHTHPNNKAAIKLLQKFNFQVEGKLREYERWNNTYEDIQIQSLLRKDFSALK